MKVTIITVCLNAVATIEECVQSVVDQVDAQIEYIVVDGGSRDGTLEVIHRFRDRIAHLTSERDKGLYDAMNKGLASATGDIVGFLNADDTLAEPNIISQLVEAMLREDAQIGYGDVEIYNSQGRLTRIYRGISFDPQEKSVVKFPPHPSVYIRRDLLECSGTFDIRFRIAADFDLLLRILHNFSPRAVYLPATIVRMRAGGISSRGLSSYWTNSRELVALHEKYGLKADRFAIYGRIWRKSLELIAARAMRWRRSSWLSART